MNLFEKDFALYLVEIMKCRFAHNIVHRVVQFNISPLYFIILEIIMIISVKFQRQRS